MQYLFMTVALHDSCRQGFVEPPLQNLRQAICVLVYSSLHHIHPFIELNFSHSPKKLDVKRGQPYGLLLRNHPGACA
jgi:hypothetical protein